MSNDSTDDVTVVPPTPEQLAFWESVKAYNNPEVFEDSSLPFAPEFTIQSSLLPDQGSVLAVKISGDNLFRAIRESAFEFYRLGTKIDAEGLSEVRAEAAADEDWLEAERLMFWFFIRHFPDLSLMIYDLAIRFSVLSVTRSMPGVNAEQDFEEILRKATQVLPKQFEWYLKDVLHTRPPGRPRKPKEEFPETVRQVLGIAEGIMAEKRGKEAVPGLKAIALILNTSEEALGRRLSRAGYPWTMIKTHLESTT